MATASAAGYSGTPLFKKLGIKEGYRILLIAAPENYANLLTPLPLAVQFVGRADLTVDIVQVFVTQREQLSKHLGAWPLNR